MFKKNVFLKAFILTAIFMLGFFTSNIYADLNTEKPTDLSVNLGNRTDEVASPSEWITQDKISVYSQRVILDIENPQWAVFTDTHSMEPVLSSRSYAIEIIPKSAEEINVGDIISYESEYATGTIVHRVIDKSSDENGIYFILKGDNNPTQDPGKIRFSQVKRVVVAIVY